MARALEAIGFFGWAAPSSAGGDGA
jgi:hypothetical protein